MNEGEPTRRLFFALWPDPAVRRAMAELARQVCSRPVPAANLHLTLAFLGQRSVAECDCMTAAAARVTGEPFELVLDFLGGWARPRIQWLGASHVPDALQALVAALNGALAPCGFEPDRRPYAAHVTLARKVKEPRRQSLETPIRWRVDEFVLAESVSTDDGVRYDLLQRWPLG